MTKANASKLGYVGRVPGTRDSDAWFTPPRYIALIRRALGGIELDPFSSDAANAVVGADRYFTLERSAFDHEWDAATVFMNPPYGVGVIGKAVARFLEQRDRYDFSGVVLVNNATETKWFHALLSSAAALCLVRGRISFWNADGMARSGNTRGQIFLYFGDNPDGFCDLFAGEGTVVLI